jgi:hypothetical protein
MNGLNRPSDRQISRAPALFSVEKSAWLIVWVTNAALVILGHFFYDWYAIEATSVLAVALVGLGVLAKGRVKIGSVPVTALLLLLLAYLGRSLVADRDGYYVARQGVIVLYVGILWCVLILAQSAHRLSQALRWMKALALVGTLSFVGWWLAGSYPPLSAAVFIMFGLALLLDHLRRPVPRFLIAMITAYGLFWISQHSSYLLGAMGTYGCSEYLRQRRIRPLVLISILGILTLLYLTDPGFSDGNANLRLAMWSSYISESWEYGYFLLGQGFGVQLVPPGIQELVVFHLVNAVQLEDWVLMATPAHNTLVTLLKHAGAPAVILLLWPLVRAFRVSGSLKHGQVPVLLSATIGVLIVGFFNPLLEAPYFAIPFMTLYGVLIASARESVSKAS